MCGRGGSSGGADEAFAAIGAAGVAAGDSEFGSALAPAEEPFAQATVLANAIVNTIASESSNHQGHEGSRRNCGRCFFVRIGSLGGCMAFTVSPGPG